MTTSTSKLEMKTSEIRVFRGKDNGSEFPFILSKLTKVNLPSSFDQNRPQCIV